jgi:low affinity Fe/Cu permease
MAHSAKEVPTPDEWYRRFARQSSEIVGSPWAFILGLFLTVAWAVSGPYFHYSDTWQLTINTGTTIVTFLMVFLIQHAQNRDAKVIQMKLDELIRALSSARTELIQMETLSDEDLDKVKDQFRVERDRAVDKLQNIEKKIGQSQRKRQSE